jgi:uncharacterized lipoprotein YmbA
MIKLIVVCLTLSLAACAAFSPHSIYEGLRTQQSIKNAGETQPVEKMGAYDAYEKEREKLKPKD